MRTKSPLPRSRSTDDRESAILAIINPGNYTAIVRGKNDTTGIAVVDVYDLGTASLDASSNAKLAQISTRGTVLNDDNVMIGGFIISGHASQSYWSAPSDRR